MSANAELNEQLIAFLDANIILEGKPVANLPWEELATCGTVRVLIVPRAMEEIDSKKRDGRLGPHARAFNRVIASSVIDGKPTILKEANPRVEMEMATCSRIPWDDYDELDPDDGDSRIVAEALHVRNAGSNKRMLISHDIKPLAYARGRGLPVYQASDNWLRPIEPSPKDKEIQRLRSQVAEYQKDEPTFEISIMVSDGDPLAIYRIAQLEREQAEALVDAIRKRNRRKSNGGSDPYGLIGGLGQRDSSYDEKYDNYFNKTIPEFVENYNNKMELLFNQRLLSIRVSNVGQIRADHLVIAIKTNDGWINQKIVAVSPSGPAAPVPSPDYIRSLNMHNNLRELIQPRVGRHEFETTIQAKRSREVEQTCEDFRSGQDYYFEGVIAPTSDPKPLVITVALTAANLRGERTQIYKLEKEIAQVDPSDLVELDSMTLIKSFPIREEMERLIDARKYDEIEWDGKTKK